MADDDAAIRTLELTKRYGTSTALSSLTMTVPPGQVFGFLGPNGSGKTTTVKLLLGLAAPTGGEAWLLGMPAGHRATRRRVGYLPELFRYQAWLAAREVLALHCRLARIPRHAWSVEIDSALATVGLADHAAARVGTFSKGMQQRLGLAVALLGDPALVILDEPTSALDPVGRHDTRTIIRELRDRGCAVFLNSHLLTEVEQVCDRVAVVSRGRMIASGTIEELVGGELRAPPPRRRGPPGEGRPRGPRGDRGDGRMDLRRRGGTRPGPWAGRRRGGGRRPRVRRRAGAAIAGGTLPQPPAR